MLEDALRPQLAILNTSTKSSMPPKMWSLSNLNDVFSLKELCEILKKNFIYKDDMQLAYVIVDSYDESVDVWYKTLLDWWWAQHLKNQGVHNLRQAWENGYERARIELATKRAIKQVEDE